MVARQRSFGCTMGTPIGCRLSLEPGRQLASERIQNGYIQELAMTHSQRLKYSILIVLVVLAIMLGLSWMQNKGMISEQLFQYIAIAVAVIVVVINGVMRRKVKP
jgi:hypothetical protein